MKAPFVSATLMHRKYPETFWVPPPERLQSIAPGDFVKVCAEPERFWVEVTNVTGDQITGRINNDLFLTSEHGWQVEDEVVVTHDNVYDVLKADE